MVTTPTNAFILDLVGYVPADSAAWISQRVEQRQTQVLILQQQRLQEWIDALRTAARIVDRRDEVLAPADEDVVSTAYGVLERGCWGTNRKNQG